MKAVRTKRAIVPGCSIWPQPKTNPRARYNITYATGFKLPSGAPERKTVSGSTDLQTTVDLAMKLSRQQERIRTGLDPVTESDFAEHARSSLAAHLADYRKSLEDAGRDPKHVRQMHDAARDVLIGTPASAATLVRRRGSKPAIKLTGAGATRIGNIIPSKVQQQIAVVKASRSAATANRYLDAVQAFLNWGVSDLRWAKNVCSHLPRYPVAVDRRVVRRVISAADFAKLVETTAAGPVICGIDGKARSLIYRVTVATALRRKQIRALKVSDLVTDDQPGVWARAKVAKNKKASFKPIPPTLASDLAELVMGKSPAAPLLNCPSNTNRMIRIDLEAAGIPYRTDEGVFDFHAIRHESGALLVSAGVPVKAVQGHMGHSTIKLTLDTYGHILDTDRAQVRKALPSFETDLRLSRRETGNQRPRTSANVQLDTKETSMEAQKHGSEQWSHGESNSDLLNAIQPSSR